MIRKHVGLITNAFFIAISLIVLILILSTGTLWPNIFFAALLASAIVIPIYRMYHYRHSNGQEKRRMISQKQIYHHYYDRWYTPADSTEMDYQIERIKKRKKPL